MTLPVSIISKPKVDIAHNEIHSGTFYSSHTMSIDLKIANPKKFLFITPPEAIIHANTIKIHTIFIVSTDLGIKIEFFENAQTSSNGTSVTIINQNRNSTISPVGNISEDPVITSEGTKIYEELIGSTTIGGTGGLTNRNEDEIILKTGTNYLLKITPLIDGVNITTHFKGYDARPSAPVPIPSSS